MSEQKMKVSRAIELAFTRATLTCDKEHQHNADCYDGDAQDMALIGLHFKSQDYTRFAKKRMSAASSDPRDIIMQQGGAGAPHMGAMGGFPMGPGQMPSRDFEMMRSQVMSQAMAARGKKSDD